MTLTHTSSLPLVQLVFVGSSVILGLLGGEDVVVWDLNRGVVSATLSATEDQSFLALAAEAGGSDGKYYILTSLGPKLVVYEYETANNKLVRKIKSGHGDGENTLDDSADSRAPLASLVVTSSHLAVRTKSSGIRVMDKNTGKKVGKIKIKTTSIAVGEIPLTIATCDGDSNILAVIQDSGAVVLYDLTSCKEMARVPPQKTGTSSAVGLQVVARSDKSGRFTVVLGESLMQVGKSSSDQEILTRFSCENPVALFLRGHRVFALIYQRAAECTARWINCTGNEEEPLPLTFSLDKEEEDVGKPLDMDDSNAKKRRPTEITVLGPGQAGSESATSAKKMKVSTEDEDEMEEDVENSDNDDENDDVKNMTIAERLQMLKEALDEDDDALEGEEDGDGVDFVAADKTTVSFQPKQATTESLKELLSQALQSSDDHLLELALMVQDVKIIATTLKEMDGELLVILLGKLTSRLASTPLRAESLSVWISHCLKRGTFNPEHLAVLRNLLYERIESFSDLLRLEGRLSMMVD
jgi:hypothetical protein